MKYAVQMYSVRDGIKNGEDLLAALGKVKEAGYEGVEFAGVQNLPAETLKARLDELGLTAVGTHIGVDDFAPENLDRTLAYYKTLGCRCIGVGGADTSSEAALGKVLTVLGGACKKCEEEGIRVYFHNHTHEFEPTKDGREKGLIIDRLKEACYLQVDTYWSFYAGVDNGAFLRENRDRICLLHLKDGVDGKPRAIGEGQNDIAGIMRAAEDIGMEWVIVENDDPVPDGVSDVTRSIQYLKKYFG